MNAEVDIEPRPFIRLYKHEIEEAENVWKNDKRAKKRLIIAPGGGFPEKCWGEENYTRLTKLLIKDKHFQICIIGAEEDKNKIQFFNNSRILNFCGKLSLRESAGLVSQSDYVITNTSLCMHLAGAFKVPSLTILGDWYDSASLHQTQWGYPECTILGKEKSVGNYNITSVDEAYAYVVKKSSVCRL
jgi:ADP-heptose:LPS heptosyltransferase